MPNRLLRLLAPALACMGVMVAMPVAAQQATSPDAAPATLFANVRIFDGTHARLSPPRHVLVEGNRISRISASPLDAPGARRIEGNGRTLMPGLIDVHWHRMFAAVPIQTAMTADNGFLNITAAAEARRTLLRGFTTVRDVGGAVFGLKAAIDAGQAEGPRIYPSGAMITVTSGHGDFRDASDLPRAVGQPGSRHDVVGDSAIADTPDEVRVRVREMLMRGASQIKLTAGGGVSSPHSPLDVVSFSEAELRAAQDAARDWGTYVTVHAYTPEAITRAIRAGVPCIEHASLMDDATARLMRDRGIWLSTQPLPPELANAFPPDSDQWHKAQEVFAGTEQTYALAKKYRLKTAFGTDVLFSQALAARQNHILASLTRWYTPAETLIMATGTNAQLLALSGKRSPYAGRVGAVEEGALADLLLVNGDPLSDIDVITDPERNFVVIMKDGALVKALP